MQIDAEMVRREIRGQATPEEKQALHDDPIGWKHQLVVLKREVEQKITQKKADSVASFYSDGAAEIVGFHEWKRGAIHFKMKVENRLSEVKVLLQKTNDDRGPKLAPILENILAELKHISGLLEKGRA